MENFVLYDEIGKADGMIIYKGRRKGTIAFLAICCVEKGLRAEITNHVRFVHEFDHRNVVKFFEWYETSNHLWLVIELCTGGTLEQIISQDGHLPESAIRRFGGDIVRGLLYMHSLEVLFADWRPSKIMLDGQGNLKYFDFSLARKVDENIEELFEQFLEGMEEEMGGADSKQSSKRSPKLEVSYMAPELLQGAPVTSKSDLWGLGCVLYLMYCGSPPFSGSNPEQVADRVVYKDFPPPRLRGPRVSGKPSPEFLSLISGLLEKDPGKRLQDRHLLSHPFWRGELNDLVNTGESVASLPVPANNHNSSALGTPKDVLFKGRNSAIGVIRGMESVPASERREKAEEVMKVNNLEEESSKVSDHSISRMSDYRPRTTETAAGDDISFTLHVGSRPAGLMEPPPESNGAIARNGNAKNATRTLGAARPGILSGLQGEQAALLELAVFDPEEAAQGVQLRPVASVDPSRLVKSQSLKFEPKTLSVPPFSVAKLRGLGQPEREKHLQQVMSAFCVNERGPPSQKRYHLINYLTTLAATPELAQSIYNHGFFTEAVRQIKENTHTDLRIRLARFIAVIMACVEVLDEEANLTEAVTILSEILRENFRVVRIKQAILTALGELVSKVALLEASFGADEQLPNWAIPSMTLTQITRCLHRNEDVSVSLLAARIIENLAWTGHTSGQALGTNEVAQLLWTTYKHSTVDALRVASMAALCHLTKLQPAVFQSVIDKIGLPAVLENLHIGLLKVQTSILTMFVVTLVVNPNSSTSRKLIQDRTFIQTIMRTLESPSVINRAKTFLILLAVLRGSLEALLPCCQHRLILYIERDIRRQTPATPASQHRSDSASRGSQQQAVVGTYIVDCLERLQGFLAQCVPSICTEVLSALDAVAGRKHPSALQGKKLKQWLILLPCLVHFVSSHALRTRVLDGDFVAFLGRMTAHCHSVDTNETNIEPSLGSGSQAELIATTLSILESLSQHGPLVNKHMDIIIGQVLPPLSELCAGSSNPDTRFVSLKLFADFAGIFLAPESGEPSSARSLASHSEKGHLDTIFRLMDDVLIPQGESFLLDQEPAPCYFLKLMTDYLTQRPSGVVPFQRMGLCAAVMQLLVEHQSGTASGTTRQALALLGCMLAAKDTDMKELFYECQLNTIICATLLEIADVCLHEDERLETKTSSGLILAGLDTLNAVLKHVSEVVRRALQVKKATAGNTGSTFDSAAIEAEQLLLNAKPLTDLMGLLAQLLCHEDADVAEGALRGMSSLASLYGGAGSDAMSAENMRCLAMALTLGAPKQQRLLLRVIKRLLATEQGNVARLKSKEGGSLVEAIQGVLPNADQRADAAVQTLGREILDMVK